MLTLKMDITNNLGELLNWKIQLLWRRVILNKQHVLPQDWVHTATRSLLPSFSLFLNKCIECISVKHWSCLWGDAGKIPTQSSRGSSFRSHKAKTETNFEVQLRARLREEGLNRAGMLGGSSEWWCLSFKIQNGHRKKSDVTRTETLNTSKMQNNLGLWEKPKYCSKDWEWSDVIGLVNNVRLLLEVSSLRGLEHQGAFYMEDENIVLKPI